MDDWNTSRYSLPTWSWTTTTSGLLCDFHPGPLISIPCPPVSTRQADQFLVVGLLLTPHDLHVWQLPLDIGGSARGTRGAGDSHHRWPQGYMTRSEGYSCRIAGHSRRPPTRALAGAPELLSAPTRRFLPRSNRRGRGGAPGGVPWLTQRMQRALGMPHKGAAQGGRFAVPLAYPHVVPSRSPPGPK